MQNAREVAEAIVFSTTESFGEEETLGGYLANLSWLVELLVGIYLVGYLLTIPIFVLSYMKRLGTGLMVATIFSLIATAFIYVVFEIALELRLHRGLLFTWLGY